MLNNLVSAISLFVALLGVSLNAIFTRPYVGNCNLGDENNPRSETPGKIANWLIFIGTFGQLIVIISMLF